LSFKESSTSFHKKDTAAIGANLETSVLRKEQPQKIATLIMTKKIKKLIITLTIKL